MEKGGQLKEPSVLQKFKIVPCLFRASEKPKVNFPKEYTVQW